MQNRRKYPRATINTEIWLGQDGIFTRTPQVMRDLSEGGAFVGTAQNFPIGSILSLRFRLPSASRFISCAVAVRNVRNGMGVGVEFLDISPEDRQEVREFVLQELPAEAPAWCRNQSPTP